LVVLAALLIITGTINKMTANIGGFVP